MIITNRDMARFAEIATLGPGPLAVGFPDELTYRMFEKLGYVRRHKRMFHITEYGWQCALEWLGGTALAPRDAKAQRVRNAGSNHESRTEP